MKNKWIIIAYYRYGSFVEKNYNWTLEEAKEKLTEDFYDWSSAQQTIVDIENKTIYVVLDDEILDELKDKFWDFIKKSFI